VAIILCVLHMCMLGIENLDALVMIYKNLLDDLRDGCMFRMVNVAKYSQGVDSSLETKMTCVGHYEIKPSYLKSPPLGEYFNTEADFLDAHGKIEAGLFEEE
jgi:hypothetical protein